MSEATIDAVLDSEAYGPGEGEASFAGDAWGDISPGEAWGDAAGDDARRRRQRQIMVARQTQARQAPPARAAVAAAPSARQTMAVVRSLDAETSMALRSLRRELEKAKRDGNLALFSATLSPIAGQGLDTFTNGLGNHDFARALIRFAPLAPLALTGDRRGAGAVLLNPAFLGAVGIAAIFISGKLFNEHQGVNSVIVSGPATVSLSGGSSVALNVIAVDRTGKEATINSTAWQSDDNTIATVDSNGNVSAASGASVTQATWITATCNGVTGRQWMTISK
jgi:hypothetical protein